MKASAFEKTPEFVHFKDARRKLLAVSKSELDARVQESAQPSREAAGSLV